MTKPEIKKAEVNKLIVDYVRSYAGLCVNYNTGGGVKRYAQHCNDLEAEFVKRGLLTEDDVKFLNM